MSRKLYAVILLAAINQNVEGNEPVRSAAFSPRSRVAPAVAVDLDADAPVWNGRAEQANRVQQTGVWIPEQSNRPLPPNAYRGNQAAAPRPLAAPFPVPSGGSRFNRVAPIAGQAPPNVGYRPADPSEGYARLRTAQTVDESMPPTPPLPELPMTGENAPAKTPEPPTADEPKADEKKDEEKKEDEKKEEKKVDEKKDEKKEEEPPTSLKEMLEPCWNPLCCGKMGPKWKLSDDVYYYDLQTKTKPVDFGGWVQAGYTNKSDGVLNTRPNRLNTHQAWLYAEKVAEQKDDAVDWGFRADALWGLDGENTQAYGNNPGKWDFRNGGFDHGSFHWAIPQLYGTLGFGKGNIKLGHFFTSAGYEVVPSTQNFFYSHSFTWNFTEPFTHTGALGTLKIDDTNELYAGYVMGWDSGFDQFHSAAAFQGGFKWTPDKDFSLIYIGTAGNNGWIGHGYTHSAVATVALTDKLSYILSHDLVYSDKGYLGGAKTRTYSANNYLLYNYSETIGAGVRGEWWRANGVNYYQSTVGVNLKPRGNIVIRPEMRYQWTPAGAANPIGLPGHAAIFGIDAILTF